MSDKKDDVNKEEKMQRSNLNNLIERLKADDQQAFDALFRIMYSRLLKFAMQFLGTQEDAEDVVSVFFIHLWQKRKDLPLLNYPETYCYTAVKNRCLNYKRAFKMEKLRHQQEETLRSTGPEVSSRTGDLEALKDVIRQAVQMLPAQRRLVFIMVKEHGLNSREVAEILNLSARTVENQLYKAVKTLAGTVSRHLGYDPRRKRSDKNVRLFLFMLN